MITKEQIIDIARDELTPIGWHEEHAKYIDGLDAFAERLVKLCKTDVSGSISLEVATKRIRQVVEYGKYKSWNNEVGEQRAKSIIDDFHNGFYGSKNGMWVQVNEAVELLEYLYSS